jgi:hypothetical protein
MDPTPTEYVSTYVNPFRELEEILGDLETSNVLNQIGGQTRAHESFFLSLT